MAKKPLLLDREARDTQAFNQGHGTWDEWCFDLEKGLGRPICGHPVASKLAGDAGKLRPCRRRAVPEKCALHSPGIPVLNVRQRRFLMELLKGHSQARAYINAGYNCAHIESARAGAGQLIVLPHIREEFERLKAVQERRQSMDADAVLAELGMLASSNISDAVRVENNTLEITNFDELPPHVLAAIGEVSETVTKDGGTLRLKMHDKMRALQLLARHYGMLQDNINVVLAPEGELADVRRRMADALNASSKRITGARDENKEA